MVVVVLQAVVSIVKNGKNVLHLTSRRARARLSGYEIQS